MRIIELSDQEADVVEAILKQVRGSMDYSNQRKQWVYESQLNFGIDEIAYNRMALAIGVFINERKKQNDANT